MKRSEIFGYLIREYFNNDPDLVTKNNWLYIKADQRMVGWYPPTAAVNLRIRDALCVSSRVQDNRRICAFFSGKKSEREIRQQLRNALDGHGSRSGIYAFYDSMANLLYVGKATNLLEEMYSALRRNIPVEFPSGVKNYPTRRFEVVRYISAYEVGGLESADYPKHVESILLRISKPPLNRNIGHLYRIDPNDGC